MTKTGAGLLTGVGLLGLVALMTGGPAPGGWLFVGRLHPSLVHLPIGILVLATAIELGRRTPKGHRLPSVPPFLFSVGALAAILTAITGLLLADGRAYDAGTLDWHRRIGLAIAVGSAAIGFLKTRKQPLETPGRWYLPSLGLLLVGLAVGGHLGGSLTHGADYLTRRLPEPLRLAAGLPARDLLTRIHLPGIDTATVYAGVIGPILDRRCGACHDAERKRGGLDLGSYDALRAGGKNGKVFAPGRPEESELIRRLWLPPGHAEAMPPNEPLPVAEAELIRWWIGEGAKADAKLAEADRTPAIRRILDSYGLDDLPTGIFALEVPPADTAAIAAIRRTGLTVEALSARSSFLRVDAINARQGLRNETVLELRSLAPQLAWVDLGGTSVGDSALAALGALPHLARLHLENTRVTDLGLSHLSRLRYLEYLNLYGTQVSDAGMPALDGLARLKRLYLWGTKVTTAGLARLKQAHPGLVVSTGDTATRIAGPATPADQKANP